MLHNRFGRDQREMLIRQLSCIHQEGCVQDYVDRFAQLFDQLAAYESTSDMLYYTCRFVDGLRDILSLLLLFIIRHPWILLFLWHYCGTKWMNPSRGVPFASRMLASFPGHIPRDHFLCCCPLLLTKLYQRLKIKGCSMLAARLMTNWSLSEHIGMSVVSVCDKCAEKWSRDHKCCTVSIHAVEVLWAIMEPESVSGIYRTNSRRGTVVLDSFNCCIVGPFGIQILTV
jgi:hypothetical protein